MRWLSIAALMACNGPEKPGELYVHRNTFEQEGVEGETLHGEQMLLVAGGHSFYPGVRRKNKVLPYVPVGLLAEWHDYENDGERDYEATATWLDDGSYQFHRDFDQDQVSDETYVFGADHRLRAIERIGYYQENEYDAQGRLVHRQELQSIPTQAERDTTLTYQGDSEDWVTFESNFNGAVANYEQQLDANGH